MILSAQNCTCPIIEEGATIVNSPICNGTLLFMVMLESFLRGRCDIADPCKRLVSEDKLEDKYDYIVVGAGSAGSIVAARLSEDDNFNVLLLEAGGPEPLGARAPSFYRSFWHNQEVDWSYRTIPDNYCLDQNGKGCLWPRGKCVGGSSVLNGMMYHRGHPADYEDWENAGAKGWSWEENLPYFDATEGNKQVGSLVSEKYHSVTGPLPVQQFNYKPDAVFDLLSAVNESGLPIVTDLNDPNTPEGFAIAQAFTEDGQRYTTARAFLQPKSVRPNLSLKLNVHVTRVLVSNKRAIGVEYLDKNREKKVVYASKEVILSAGAINSPQILLLSGIGPKEDLERLNIPVVEDLPVGKNFRNHVGVTLNFILTKRPNIQTLDWVAATQYLLERKGPMSSTGITQVTGLLYSRLADRKRQQPDIQFFFNGLYAECSRTGAIGEPVDDCYENGLNVSANAALLLPRSVGYLTLNSTDPFDPPILDPNYFSHPDDMLMIIDGVRYLKRIFNTTTMQEKYGTRLDAEEAAGCTGQDAWSDEWAQCMARLHTDPQNHQFGTTAIGLVVDPQLQVYNIEGLRVIDSGVIPRQVTGNPQAAIMMAAERGAAFIKEKSQN